jgi:hypothetical protein
MAKHFGIRINTGLYTGLKFLVLPESHHIFEPKDGDEHQNGWVYVEEDEAWKLSRSNMSIPYHGESSIRIDFCEGNHFFMPRIEEV